MIEIRWHARGGQGAVTASKILASSAIREGKYAQSAPDYGAERAGAPLRSFNRVSEEPITLHCLVLHPDIVVVVDPTLLKTVPILEGTDENAILVVNTDKSPAQLREYLGVEGRKIYTVNASQIAMEELKKPLMNIPMLGALVKVIEDLVSLESVEEDIKATFGKKITQELLNANLKALDRAYREVKGE
ncbi:2-oxoacid:acceptor oxidoreductase family protein [Desulfurobacterium atlanticum]|uniref:Pyruvate ferredoxin oxidoreductase gamma subunit n=1 Tax=Desulfurobacterium atlanticum TaxID=240169 RepID=A0A238XIP3_9BACT|nr:2-oxoacid:acceptor oxidoreductase family protein [Desulfurobacterium atlanticum]SNR58875.1 pyruvate ferredoxin oxidoreductase gamma subunit [Desulfurobacterium atlanticum]